MLKKIKIKIKKNLEIIGLSFLILVTIIFTSYYNYNKKKIFNNYSNLLDNVYFKKSINHLLDNLEPRFKKMDKINIGETFDEILEKYLVDKSEILQIKEELSKKVNINKLNINQKFKFTIDQTNSSVKEFIFQISNTEKFYLSRNETKDKFSQKIIFTKLKKIVYNESIILESLYKSALNENILPNIIIDFARIYGFEVDFQRDIRKEIVFKLCTKYLKMIMEK